MEYWIDPPAEKILFVCCPECDQECEINRNFKIDCPTCEKRFPVKDPYFYPEEAAWLHT